MRLRAQRKRTGIVFPASSCLISQWPTTLNTEGLIESVLENALRIAHNYLGPRGVMDVSKKTELCATNSSLVTPPALTKL